MALLASLLSLRRDGRLLQLPPYLSFLCIVIGVAWLLLLPLDEYSRKTYVSENALLPGQVHTYFGGTEHNIFRAFRHEVAALVNLPFDERVEKLSDLFKSTGLQTATQQYLYHSSGRNITGKNVYAVIRGPRADATEAIVLIGAWKTMAGEVNQSGMALVFTLARYFKRWSLWSKDLIFLIPSDPLAGTEAWVSAYHDAHDPATVESLSLRSGALQGALAVEYPAGPWGHRYDKIHIVYDGVNGQLPNLDLINTAANVASGQVGVGCTIQRMWQHDDKYRERLTTIVRGMVNQGLGHASGPHSSFIPYHVDAITLQTVGDGWNDEISLGRTVESLFRSLNNLLEHLHQSFFFYLLMEMNRFVSIGTYLPSAMIIAASYTITAIALWVQSGRDPIVSSIKAEEKLQEKAEKQGKADLIKQAGPTVEELSGSIKVVERHLFSPISLICAAHILGLVPLYIFNNISESSLVPAFLLYSLVSFSIPVLSALALNNLHLPTRQQIHLTQSLSLLLLGLFLSALATLNFSLSFLTGLLCAPLSFIRSNQHIAIKFTLGILLLLLSPVSVIAICSALLDAASHEWKLVTLEGSRGALRMILREASDEWHVRGVWTPLVVWVVWWPAWVVGGVILGVKAR